MTTTASGIERLRGTPDAPDLRALAELLVDAIKSGAAVSFLAPMSVDRAEQWWRGVLSTNAVVLVARDAGGVVGTVTLHPAWAPNQPHRAEIAKLLVHRRARRAGLGERLMREAESVARCAGCTLLTLDAKVGAEAERLYRRLGWTEVGVIPRYAVDPDGVTPHDAVIFYKRLA